MRIITINLNGIRAAARKGLYDWLSKQNADIVCLQELKAQTDVLDNEQFNPKGYYSYFHCAEKKGYSGVGIYSKQQPDNVTTGFDYPLAEQEGRYIQADFKGLSVASLYLPSGSSGDERQQIKFQFMDAFMAHMKAFRRKKRELIVCGDFNTVHQRIDIENWNGNQKNSGCLPEERQWIDDLFNKVGYIDAFRSVDDREKQYTWWSNRGQAWAKNVGWRIDYHIISPGLRETIQSASIYKAERFSDHAPLLIDYNL